MHSIARKYRDIGSHGGSGGGSGGSSCMGVGSGGQNGMEMVILAAVASPVRCTFLLFQETHFMGVCYDSPRKLMQLLSCPLLSAVPGLQWSDLFLFFYFTALQ